MSDYRMSPLRRAAQTLHKLYLGLGRGLELAWDGFIWLLLMVGICGGVAHLLSSWVPITGTWTDYLLWIALWLMLNVLLGIRLRAARHRRFGPIRHHDMNGLRAVCGYVFGGWFGVLAAVAFVRAATSSQPFGLWGTTMLLLALATLGLTCVGLYKYVTERGDADEL